MRNSWRFLLVALFGVTLVNCVGWAQNTKATSMAGEIRRYELLVQEKGTQQDGATWWRLAMLYQDTGRYGDAERAYSNAVGFLKTGDRATLANAVDGMGTMYVETGRYAKAAPLEREALAIREEQNDSVGVGRSWMHLAMLSLGKHNVDDAARYAELAVERLVPAQTGNEDHNAATPEEKMSALINLSLARCAQGLCAAAIPELERAHTLAQASYQPESFPVAFTDFLLGYAHWKSGDARTAADLMKSGTTGMEAQLGWGHPTYISAMKQYEAFLKQTRRNAEAAEVRAKLAQIQVSQRRTEAAGAETMLDLMASR
jgi:tetratricopeptide (TPR) repeat protein